MTRQDIDVSVFDYGRRGYRVRVFQAPPKEDFNAMGRRLYETFKLTKASANKLAKELAAEYGVTPNLAE